MNEELGVATDSTVSEPEGGHWMASLEGVLARLRQAAPTLMWVVVGLGVVLRLGRYLHNPSLWLDELWLAINITGKSWDGLHHSLSFLQAAPLGFLFAEKAATTTFGDSEYVLRAIPLLSSVAALLLFQHVARRVLSPLAALLALVLFTTSPIVLFQSAQMKPYSSDAAIGLLLVALGLRTRQSGPTWRPLWPLALVAPVALFMSFPAILVLGAVYAMLIAHTGRRDPAGGIRLTVMAATWLVVFGVLYAIQAPNLSRTSTAILGTSGVGSAATANPTSVAHDAWATFVDPAGFRTGTNGLAVLLFLIGALAFLRRRDYELFLLLVSPLAIAMLAAFVGKYPLGGRVSLFLVPFLILVVAAGAENVVAEIRLAPQVSAVLLVIFLVGPSLAGAARDLVQPPQRDEVKPLLRILAREGRPGDGLYLSQDAQYAVRYYATCNDCDPPGHSFPWRIPATEPASADGQFAPAVKSTTTIVVGSHDATPVQVLLHARPLWTQPRVWFLFVHEVTFEEQLEKSVILSELVSRGHLIEQHSETGAHLYLYEPKMPG